MGKRPQQTERGFTIVELVVVLAIIGIATKVVLSNLGSMVPSTALNEAATKLSARFDFLRAEARLRGKPFTLRLDLDNHRYRVILPPEDLLQEDQYAKGYMELNWQSLNKWTKFIGHANQGQRMISRGTMDVTFDQNGFSSDQSIYLGLVEESTPKRVWTLHLFGLSGATDLIKDYDGKMPQILMPVESNF